MDKSRVVCIVGTTATGKSDLAVKIAKEYGGEVVSADSMQIYKGFDIGTAKITREQMQGIPHHMINIVKPDGAYSVADYCSQADMAIADILSKKRLPIIAGGTGLYVDSLLSGQKYEEMKTDPEYRHSLVRLGEQNGVQNLWNMLYEVDKPLAESLHPNNVKRVIRGLEVYNATGRPLSEIAKQSKCPPKYNVLKIGLKYADRTLLYERIEQRVDKMMESGLCCEVVGLLEMGINRNCQSMQAIGYKELADAIDGKLTFSEAVEQIKQSSRRYAKRQLTWFGRDKQINWFEIDKEEKLFDKVKYLLENNVIT